MHKGTNTDNVNTSLTNESDSNSSSELETLKKKLEEAQQTIASQKEDYRLILEQLESSHDDMKELGEKLSTQKDKNSELLKKLLAANMNNSKLQDETKIDSSDNKILTNQFDANLNEAVENLKMKLEDAEQTILILKEQKSDFEINRLTSVKEINESLLNSLKLSYNRNHKLADDLSKLRRRDNEKLNKLVAANMSNSKLQNELANLEKSNINNPPDENIILQLNEKIESLENEVLSLKLKLSGEGIKLLNQTNKDTKGNVIQRFFNLNNNNNRNEPSKKTEAPEKK